MNVAARVEGLTKQYGLPILITENTVRHASGLALLEVDLVRVIGRAEPIAIFTCSATRPSPCSASSRRSSRRTA